MLDEGDADHEEDVGEDEEPSCCGGVDEEKEGACDECDDSANEDEFFGSDAVVESSDDEGADGVDDSGWEHEEACELGVHAKSVLQFLWDEVHEGEGAGE